MIARRLACRLTALVLVALAAPAGAQEPLEPAPPGSRAEGVLVERLRQGGAVLFFRHADTSGEPCDSLYRIGQRDGQRNISEDGRAQSAAIGRRMTELDIPVALPVLAGPVFRARDTAEIAFGAGHVEVTDSLLADDYAGSRLSWILAEHERLFGAPVDGTGNRVLVGHRGPATMVIGSAVRGRALPEGGAIVIEPRGGDGYAVLGILDLAPAPSGGFSECNF
ncbi:histidine phosphatase family protein [Marinivivus vitaminiproducens]|uniref:histidine phosphatase family protein n=1 Tax=Marinivivus vitaminiproducens TaxID=3035935 RepID=UPI00279B8B48|nr:histidine phosphatase family protein [Geminicoccaceae bacterium SCSIO 64248]